MKQITFTNIRIILFIAGFGLINNSLRAQETEVVEGILSNISISGSVDSYFRTNFNGLNKFEFDENGDETGFPQAPASSFANDPGFAIGMANIILGYEGEKVGFVADLVFGPRGEDAVFLSGPSTNRTGTLGKWRVYPLFNGATISKVKKSFSDDVAGNAVKNSGI